MVVLPRSLEDSLVDLHSEEEGDFSRATSLLDSPLNSTGGPGMLNSMATALPLHLQQKGVKLPLQVGAKSRTNKKLQY
jgi:hypothetical protein